MTVNPEPARSVDLDTIFDQDLLWTQARDFVKVPKESLSAIRALIKKVGCAMQVSNIGYVDLVQQLAGEVKDARQKSGVD